jgi:hypothetical protein
MSIKRKTAFLRIAGCTTLIVLVLVVGAAQAGQQVPAATTLAEPAAAATVPAQTVSPHHQQLVDDSARLLALAVSLKTEVDKTTKDTLSLNVIRRADEIEKLAHTVREHMKSAGTGS